MLSFIKRYKFISVAIFLVISIFTGGILFAKVPSVLSPPFDPGNVTIPESYSPATTKSQANKQFVPNPQSSGNPQISDTHEIKITEGQRIASPDVNNNIGDINMGFFSQKKTINYNE